MLLYFLEVIIMIKEESVNILNKVLDKITEETTHDGIDDLIERINKISGVFKFENDYIYVIVKDRLTQILFEKFHSLRMNEIALQLYNKKIGFKFTHTSKPSYSYVVNKKRTNRYTLRKDVLVSKYGCPLEITEKEFCNSKGWYRIYDCGCLCYKWEQ